MSTYLSVVVPAFNEEGNIPAVTSRIAGLLDGLGYRWELILVDDGSRDATFAQMREAAAADPRVRALRFSRNFGSHAAITAGLERISPDAGRLAANFHLAFNLGLAALFIGPLPWVARLLARLFPEQVTVADPEAGSVAVVPVSSLLEADGGLATVFVVAKGDVARKVSVRTGRLLGERIEVVAGLDLGQRVVTEGAAWLDDNQKVRVLGGA